MKKTKYIILFLLVILNAISIKVIAIDDYKAKTYIDIPGQNMLVNHELEVEGWVMTNDEQAQIEVYIDEEKQEIQNLQRIERADVWNVITGYGTISQNPKPGYIFRIDTSKIMDGEHKLEVRIISSMGEILTSDSRNISLKKFVAKTYIDMPNNSNEYLIKDELKIEGWVMSDEVNYEIKAYINGQEQEIQELQRIERPDVLRVITGHGTVSQNPNPGYIFRIDTSKITDGEHILEVRIISSMGEILTSDSRNINLREFVAKTYIDMPNNSNEYLIKDELEIEGWIMSNDVNYEIKAYINGQEQEIQELQRIERPDVLRVITGYGTVSQNPKPGYILKIDTSEFDSDIYNLEISVVSSTGEKLANTNKKVIIQRYTAKSYIDTPVNNAILNPNFIISGWVMTDDEKASIKVYIDGKEQTIKNIIREERQDVIKAIIGYGGIEKNPTPGFQIFLENTKFNEGEHSLEIKVISKEGKTISNSTQTINYENYKAKTYIDNPAEGKVATYENNLFIRGWLMTNDINSNIKVYIGEEELTIKNIVRKEREDVLNAIHGYGGAEKNPKPGYEISADIPANIKDGKYALKINIISSTGEVLETATRNIEINKYKAKGYIDEPVSMEQAKDTLSFRGWIMSTDENAQIKIYIDNKEIQFNEFEREERQDVISAITGYGGLDKNPKPGYKGTVDIKQFSEGTHTLRIEAISREGKIMYIQNKAFVICNDYGFGIDVSYHNGTIDWTKVKEAGVEFAMIRAGFRGYGQTGTLNKDSKFVENMKGAIANKIDVGVYFYSQAINVDEAIVEADYVIELLRKNGFQNSLTLPIVIDTEEVDNAEGRADSLTKAQRTLVVQIFCERIKQYGYTPMIYANKWWLMEKLDMNQLKGYDVWLAHYTGTNDPINNPSDYTGGHQMWQYTETGKINGISTNVDLNICYKKY